MSGVGVSSRVATPPDAAAFRSASSTRRCPDPAPGFDELDPLAARGRQPIGQHAALFELDADDDLVRDERTGRVVLLDVLGDHRRIGQLLILLLERAATDELAGADEQHDHLDGVGLAM